MVGQGEEAFAPPSQNADTNTPQPTEVRNNNGTPQKLANISHYPSLLYERWTAGSDPIGDPPLTGMISQKTVLNQAIGKLGKSNSLNVDTAEIYLIEETYVVCVPRYKEPFYYYPEGLWNFGRWLLYNAWTGEYIGAKTPTDSVIPIGFSNKTGGDGTEESAKANKSRLSEAIREMHNNIRHGKVTESEPQNGMIDSGTAVKSAENQINDRNYDPNKEAWPILINDIYIVTFWKKDEDINPKGGRTYDCRVGVDATTGEFIAMDVAPPFRRKKSVKE
jgi:hypothetical protein